MALGSGSFSSQIDTWVAQSERRMEAVFKESTKRVVAIAQSNIPIDTGFARASIRGSLDEMPQANRAKPSSITESHSVPYNDGEIISTIASAKLGDTVYIGWTANYAIYLEYGHSRQAPSGFIRLAALQWNQIVEQVTAELKNRQV